MQPIETYELSNDRVLKIYPDDDPENPRDWEPLGHMICWHSRYTLGDTHTFQSGDDEDLEKVLKGAAVVLPLYLYDHSGITMNTSGFSCSWDSGQVGWIYATQEEADAFLSEKNVSKEKIEQVLKAEVEVYDQLLTGDIYGFVFSQKKKCNLGYIHEEEIDSCWGFFGGDIKTNGILDNLPEDVVLELTSSNEETG